MDQISEERLLAELEPEVRALFTQVRGIDGGCLLLRFLDEHANALMTVEDIAFHLCEPSGVVENTLYAMRELGLVREVVVAGSTFLASRTIVSCAKP